MSSAIFHLNSVILIIIGFQTTDVISHWERYQSCHSPIQLFLLLTYCTIILHRVLIVIKHLITASPKIKKSLTFAIYGIIQPIFLYLTIQGMIWQNLNFTFTPDCIPNEELPFMVWGWIIFLIIFDGIFVYITISKLITWWKIRALRRRMYRIVDELLIMNENTLQQILLANPDYESMTNIYVSRDIGISHDDRAKIPVMCYKKEIAEHSDNIEICPICCDEFQEDVEIKSLPGCKHLFHSICVDEWLKVNSLCPMCRACVRSNLNEYENRNERSVYYEENRYIEDLEANL